MCCLIIAVDLVFSTLALVYKFGSLRATAIFMRNWTDVSSEAGFVGRPGQVVYDAIKAAIVSATKTMAQEFADAGIRVNAVAPGWTVTEMHFERHTDPSARKLELESLSIASCVLKRLAQPSEIAGAIAFLLSDDASYITGTTLHVDGGRVGLSVK